ncbi:MAG: MBOAT family protein [Alphaproteobacteria bacterium]|nr:MBOAT family protein [Alphaproteobacteria bacterium]
MLFNSPAFLFGFLPVCLAVFIALKKANAGKAALVFLALASLFFYAWWDFRFLGLLLTSIGFNFCMGIQLRKYERNKLLLILGIAANLVCLGFFKYFNFFIDNLNLLLAHDLTFTRIILPLGISFFTFQQIAYLVDTWKGKAQAPTLLEYTAYITFFPHLIAGPIVHHATVIPQFRALPAAHYDWHKTAIGLTLFAIGLFKKVMLADSLSVHATPIFNAAHSGEAISLLAGWIAALAYTLQLYFDFSAYSDMAIGLGLMFGIRLPDNFFSPYKAGNIIDFWRRWHITLSNFLRNYLYIPLGGNRAGKLRRYANLIITMLLGGLWHGANWTFVLWGGLHGLYLVINHGWHRIVPDGFSAIKAYQFCAWALTFLAVITAWVLFRSESVEAAMAIYQGMLGWHGLGATTIINDALAAIIIGLIIALCAPNGLQIIKAAEERIPINWYSWQLSTRWVAFTAILLATSLYFILYTINRISEFIYFQF